MTTIIKDGTGTGRVVKVDTNNELRVRSRSAELRVSKAISGHYFTMATPALTVTTSTTGKLWYFQLTEDVDLFALDSLDIYWNGGSTNYNKTVEIKQYTGGAVAPTTNTTAGSISNTNLGSANALDGTFLYWDGVSTGMSGDVAMYQIGSLLFAPGYSSVNFNGRYLLEPTRRYAFGATVPEDGELVIQLYGYIVDLDIDNGV